MSGSLTDTDQYSWNIQKLGSILDCLGDDYGISIEGESLKRVNDCGVIKLYEQLILVIKANYKQII